MPKIGKPKCRNLKAHQQGVSELLKVIAKKHDKRRGDVVIAYTEDISVYAVRMWMKRPIPKKHWETLVKLSGFSMNKIQGIARDSFVMDYVGD